MNDMNGQRTNPVFLSHVSEKFIRERKGPDGTSSYIVSFNMNDGKGTYGSFIAKPGQVLDTMTKSKTTGESVKLEGYKEIGLSPDTVISVSVNDREKGLSIVKLTGAEIKAKFDGAREAYRAEREAKIAEELPTASKATEPVNDVVKPEVQKTGFIAKIRSGLKNLLSGRKSWSVDSPDARRTVDFGISEQSTSSETQVEIDV